MNFEMSLDIKFNREIVKDKDYISPGGYEMTTNGKNVQFDFEDYRGYILEDQSVLHCEMEYPDVESFEDLRTISADDLRAITKIVECFIYTGEDSDLTVDKIVSISFFVPTTGETIPISDDVVNEYNKEMQK